MGRCASFRLAAIQGVAMSIKSILVAVGPGRENDSGQTFAISIGAKLDAYVTGHIYPLEPERRGVAMLNDKIFARHRASIITEARATAAKFKEAAAVAKVHSGV